MTMPAGRYYIGDLCYVMHPEWNEVCDITIQDNRCLEGEFTLKDSRRFATFSTAYGDGTYRSSIGTDHAVDSGSIGCILVSDIRDSQYDNIEELGAIVEFDRPFEVSKDQGLLVFGHVEIETAGDYDWDEEDEAQEA